MKLQKLEYIEGTGTQYIDTGISASDTTLKVEISYMPTAGYTGEYAVFGSTWSESGYFLMLHNSIWKFHSGGSAIYTRECSTTEYAKIITTYRSISINATEYTLSPSRANSANTLILFGDHGGYGPSVNLRARGRLKYCKMWLNDIIVRDFIAVLDEAGIPCLYDYVSKGYFLNAGSGTFGYEIKKTGLYLVKDSTTIYTVTDRELVDLQTTDLTAELFQTHGMENPPTSEILLTLNNPKVLAWSDEEQPEITATVTATPYPQTIYSPEYDMTDPTILGIEKVIAVASEDVMFAVSFDGGETWKYYTGTDWATLSEDTSGMGVETIMAVPTDKWTEVATTGTFKVRATLPSVESTLSSFIVDYLNA